MPKILIVDDRPINRLVLIEVLKYNHEILEAGDGTEALAVARAEHPDLVISDVLMPSMDGYELVRQLHADTSIPPCPVVFYTAYFLEEEARALAQASGVTLILHKPCEPERVLQVVDEALRHSFPAPLPLGEDIQNEHQRLLTNKLAQHVEELETANNRLRAIVEFGLQLSAQLAPERIMEEGCRAACEIAGAQGAAIAILDEGFTQLVHLTACGPDSPGMTAGDFLHLQRTVLDRFMAEGRACRLHDAAHPLFPAPPVHSLLAVPISSPTRTYGWLVLLDKPAREQFSDSDERVARMIAAKVGNVYENRLFFMEIERRSRELENEVMEREMLEEELRSAHDEMESQVAERTAELAESVEALRAEIAEREKAEAALQAKTAALERAVEELSKKDRMLVQQSRQAAMGEMIGNIAHQWRQPLNALGLIVQGLDLAHECGELSREYLDGSVERAMETIFHMSRTIDDFSNFFKPDREKVAFHVSEVVARAIALIKETFDQQRIRIDISSDGDPVITGYPNEYSQALLNVLLNARDALRDRNIGDARITVRCFEENAKAVVRVADNAGGIAEEIMDRIFDPYFTTKFQDKGTGIGLFMAKAIIEKNMGGTLSVHNTELGAEFTISV